MQKALEDAEAEKQRVLEAKKEAEEELAKQQAKQKMAKEAAEAAAKKQAEAEEAAANWKKQAKAAKEKAAKEMAAAEKAAREEEERLKKEQEAQAAKHEAALKAQAESLKKAAEAQRKADEAARKAREQQEKKQMAYLKQQMAERKAAFSSSFSHTWSSGAPGVSHFELNMDLNAGSQEEIITKLFQNKIVADLQTIPGSSQRFVYNHDGNMDQRIEFIKLEGTVNDQHLEEFRALVSHFTETSKYQKGSHGLPAFDLVVLPLGTGNKEYIEWALAQTTKDENSPTFKLAEKTDDKKPEGESKVQIKENTENREDEEEDDEEDEQEE